MLLSLLYLVWQTLDAANMRTEKLNNTVEVSAQVAESAGEFSKLCKALEAKQKKRGSVRRVTQDVAFPDPKRTACATHNLLAA